MRSAPEVTARASDPHHSLDREGNWSSERERDLPEATERDRGEPAPEPRPPAMGGPNSGHVSLWEDTPDELGLERYEDIREKWYRS